MNADTSDLRDQLRTVILGTGDALSTPDELTPDDWLSLIERASIANSDTSTILSQAVLSARAAGVSWEAIGSRLGMTRQAAQQRFGKGSTPGDVAIEPDRRRVTGLTAFNEIAELNRLGAWGWHSVGNGPLYHDVERDDVQWEHRRVIGFLAHADELQRDGWVQAGTPWFPWVYWARPTKKPALPGSPFVED